MFNSLTSVEDKRVKKPQQDMEWNILLNKGLDYDWMIEKEKQEQIESENQKARKTIENIKKLRLQEGPEEPQVYAISQKVEKVVIEKERAKLQGVEDEESDPNKAVIDILSKKIQEGIREENRIIRETYDIEGNFDAIYKTQPGIKPINSTMPVQLEEQPFIKSRRSGASLQDLVLHDFSQKTRSHPEQLDVVSSGQFEPIHAPNDKVNNLLLKSSPIFETNENNPFVRWGSIKASLQQILNTQKFGDVYTVTTKEETIIKDFFLTRYPTLQQEGVQFKIGKVNDREYSNEGSLHLASQVHVKAQQFNVVFYGQHCPISKCCRLSLCLCICGITGTAKINCMASAATSNGEGGALLSHYNPQQ